MAGALTESDAVPRTAPRTGFTHRPELDGLRGLAVATVVLYHFGKLVWPEAIAWLAPGGQSGLDLFFALSGFLIATLLLAEHAASGRVGLGRFWWRRLLRLVPALAVLMVALVASSFVRGPHSPGHVASSAGWVLTFATNFGTGHVISELGHTWSLSVEAHFYLLWSLATAAVTAWSRRPHHVLAAIAVAGVVAVAVGRAAVYAGGGNLYEIYVGSPHRLDGPLVGALAGVALAAGWLDAVPRRVAAAAGAAALGLYVLAAYVTRSFAPGMFYGGYTAVALCAAVLVVAPQLAGPGPLRRALSARPLARLGRVSYSVYLWHFPVFLWLDRNGGDWPVAARAAVAAVSTAVVATASYRLVERPVLRRARRPRPAPAPSPSPVPVPEPAPASAS